MECVINQSSVMRADSFNYSALYRQIASYFPPDLQAIILNPPSFSSPSSFLPVIRIVLPYTKWIIVLVATCVIWTTVSSLFGYFSRLVRFGFRIGPILALIAWVMASSGQGNMHDLFEVAKQWLGLAPGNHAGGISPGIASLAGLFGGDSTKTRRSNKRGETSPRTGGGLFGSRDDPISARTRNKKTAGGNDDPDIISSMLRSATDLAGDLGDGDWQNLIQDYVKNVMVKATGLEWLLGKREDEAREGRSWRSR